ncbi:hypothetical protein SPONN_1699 [uncultured Candidatus Thioglobus sp.]|nr:hypothetical protein SPONN_1699 [uncultured Candidatus Thioglobus sp.]
MNKLNLSVLLLASVFLTACGGGTTSARSDSASGFSGVSATQYKTAADTTPKQGSVIQSNINNRPNLGVDVTKTGVTFADIAGEQSVAFSGANDRITHEDIRSTENTDGNPDLDSPDFSLSVYERDLSAGNITVINAIATYGAGDNDYLSYGIWGYRADNDNHEIGFYIDGGDPFTVGNIAGLTGQATYSMTNGALAVYRTPTNSGAALGDVSLIASFGDSSSRGTISGTINNMRLYSSTLSLEGDGEVSDIVINLESANIGSEEGGFWTGNTAGSGRGDSYAGKWGGQFYVNGASATDEPGIAAGTFGGANDDGSTSFVGAFVALKQ